jgi:hypothetical protein
MQLGQPDIRGNLKLPPDAGVNLGQPYFELIDLFGFTAFLGHNRPHLQILFQCSNCCLPLGRETARIILGHEAIAITNGSFVHS